MASSVEFHDLRVSEVTPLTDDVGGGDLRRAARAAASVSTSCPGQHVTLRATVDGEDLRRSYSICANANEAGKLRVGIKTSSWWSLLHLGDARASRHGRRRRRHAPGRRVHHRPRPDTDQHRVAIVAGSGITPVLSLLATTLESEPGRTWTVVFGNRTANQRDVPRGAGGTQGPVSGPRLQLFHLLSREGSDLPLALGSDRRREDRDHPRPPPRSRRLSTSGSCAGPTRW